MEKWYLIHRCVLVFLGMGFMYVQHVHVMQDAAYVHAQLIQPPDLLANNSLSTVAISAQGKCAAFAATNRTGIGKLYVYQHDIKNSWNLFQEIVSPAAGSAFGTSLAISADGSIIAVGAPSQSSSGPNGPGAVYLYVRDENTGLYGLYQTILDPDPAGNEFGWVVDLSATGATLLVGDPAFKGKNGAAYTYVCMMGTTKNWTLQQQLLEPGVAPGSNDYFAISVKLSTDGNYVVIGSPFGGVNGSGTAYVFQQASGAWSPVATLSPSDTSGTYLFGNSVSISGDGLYIIVGAPFQKVTGLAYVFHRSDTVWNRREIIAPQSGSIRIYGYNVAMSNNGTKSAIAGFSPVPRYLVEVYDRFDSSWYYMQTVAGTVVQGTPDAFGSSLTISGDGSFLGVGAPETGNTGAGYIFH